MIIHTFNVVAIRCPSCGRLEFRGFSLFDFGGDRMWQIDCSCGTPLMKMEKKKGRTFCLQYRCGMCDGLHLMRLTHGELWARRLLTLTCRETELDVGFIGPREKVQRAVQRHDRSLVEAARDLGYDDFFEEPEIMYQLLSLIYQKAEEGRVRCGCGNENIEVEIFPGHLKLRCQACRAEKTLPALTYTDLEQVEELQEIRLPGRTRQRTRRRRQKTRV
ncbi:hypothetical protein MHOCP_23860 [Moorella humiferrea]|uniref:Uncharacterized protein n=1 Tax=Neomoorella humiferrea TaxID=676965 RepID=A0A2T0AKZ7_9FIRM|nr:hypothetical protein [Moorella humiferrea]PRR69278.1 hypothetical protein MOHU_23750 [Moorella humiferrea]